MSLSVQYIENLTCSTLYDKGLAVPCGLQYGEVSHKLWSSWFALVDQINDGQSKKPNKDNLSLWRDGRGSFVDGYSLQDKAFFDVKALKQQKKLQGAKFELWAGSPVAGDKRSDAMDMTKDEVVQKFIENKESHQIYQSLTSQDKPYILMIAFPTMSANNTWKMECIVINISAYLKHRQDDPNICGARSKSGISGLIYRTKVQTSVDYNESISARVEVKIWDTHEQMVKLGFATPVQSIESSFASIL